MRVIYPATIQKRAIAPASTQEHLKRLFDILIPTLHGGQRFIYSDGVLCDKGEVTNFASHGESIVENYPLSFITTTLSQRRIGLAISAIYDKGKDGFGLKDVGESEQEAVKEVVMESPCQRVSNHVALLLVLLERTFGCDIEPVPEWTPIFRAVLEDGVIAKEPVTAYGCWRLWLLHTLPTHRSLVDSAFKAATIAHHKQFEIVAGGEEAPRATPPRVRNLRKERIKRMAFSLHTKVSETEKITRSRGGAYKS